MENNQTNALPNVLCCLCGITIQPNPSNMCVNCVRSQVDVTEGIQKQCSLLHCKDCGRWLQPPKTWIVADPESKELLTHCIRKLKGINKVKLVDAGFIWTEPHSKRIKVKLSIQKEVFNSAILQQEFVVEYIVENYPCDHCSRAAANPNQWTACVQVRQRVEHKRTFLYLEQLILKYGAADQAINIKERYGGVDFYFGNRSHALKFIDFLHSTVPEKHRHDKQLVSQDDHNNSYNYKYTFSVEIVPICRDDIICLPKVVANSLGSLGPIVLCTKVSNNIQLMDPQTLQVAWVDSVAYWRKPYKAMLASRALLEFYILDVELVGPQIAGGKIALAQVECCRMTDVGKDGAVMCCKTHLGNIIGPGDTVLGYDLSRANLVDESIDEYKGLQIPDVVLVRKSYAESRKKRKQKGKNKRAWKLKQMDVEPAEVRNKAEHASALADRERFLEELEENPEMRAQVQLYKDPEYQQQNNSEDELPDYSSDDSVPEVPLEELVEAMTIDE